MVSSKRVYGLTTPFVSVFPDPITKTAAPTASDKNYPNGFVWIYKNGDTRTSYMYGGLDSSGDAVWILAGPGSSDVDTISGDSGTATPSAGNINIVGGTNITTTGASPTGDDVSVALDAAITLATSITSPLYTTAAATDLLLTGVSGQDVVMKLGDAAGATKFSITDSADSEVFAVDSNGGITFTNFSNTGTFTTAGGTASINASSNFNTVINSGTSTGTVTIGNAAAGAITVDTAAGISLDGATASNFTVTGAADLTLASTAGSIPITAGEAAADAIVLNASDGAGGVQIQAGTGGVLIGNQADCTTIDVGDIAPTASRTITVGGGQVATAGVADTIDIGVDAVTTEATASKVINIGTGTNDTGSLTLNMVSGTITSGTVAVNLLSGTGTKTLNIGNSTGTTTNLDGPFLVNDSINSNTSINTGTSTGTISIGNSAAGAVTVDTAAGISLDAATASNFTVTGAAADLTLNSVGGSVNISATEDDAGAIAINANGGTSEKITVTASQGTGVDSIGLVSTAGGLTLSAALASDDAINLSASAGGVDIDGAMQVNIASSENTADAISINSSAGGIDIVAAGAAGEDIDITCTSGSVNITAGESAADALIINASGAAGAIQLNSGTGGVVMDSGLTVNVTAVNNAASPYTLLGSDYVLAVDTSAGAVTVTLPAGPATGRTIVVVDEAGNAAAQNITISGNGNNIAGGGTLAATDVIDSAYGTMTLYFTGTIWNAQDIP